MSRWGLRVLSGDPATGRVRAFPGAGEVLGLGVLGSWSVEAACVGDDGMFRGRAWGRDPPTSVVLLRVGMGTGGDSFSLPSLLGGRAQ